VIGCGRLRRGGVFGGPVRRGGRCQVGGGPKGVRRGLAGQLSVGGRQVVGGAGEGEGEGGSRGGDGDGKLGRGAGSVSVGAVGLSLVEALCRAVLGWAGAVGVLRRDQDGE